MNSRGGKEGGERGGEKGGWEDPHLPHGALLVLQELTVQDILVGPGRLERGPPQLGIAVVEASGLRHCIRGSPDRLEGVALPPLLLPLTVREKLGLIVVLVFCQAHTVGLDVQRRVRAPQRNGEELRMAWIVPCYQRDTVGIVDGRKRWRILGMGLRL